MLGVVAVCSSPTAKAWYPSPLLVIADQAGCQRRFCYSTAAAPATPAAPPARRPTGTPSSISNSATGSPRTSPSPGYEHRCSSPTPPMTATAPLPRCKPCSAEPDSASSYSSDCPPAPATAGPPSTTPTTLIAAQRSPPASPPSSPASQRRNRQPGSASRLLRNALTSLAISSGYSPLMAWEASG